MKAWIKLGLALLAAVIVADAGMSQTATTQQLTAPLPSAPIKFGAFVARFDPGGTFTLQGQGWPALNGNWKSTGAEIELTMSGGPGGCDGPGRYQFRVDGSRVSFDVVSDTCTVRRMIIDRSTWIPATETVSRPPRNIVRTAAKSTSTQIRDQAR